MCVCERKSVYDESVCVNMRERKEKRDSDGGDVCMCVCVCERD